GRRGYFDRSPGDPLMGYRVGTVQRSRRASPAETALRHAEQGICELVAEIPKL
ncbi:unnamed protein product, partial [Musa acuminata subsp. burmannicoides]